MYLHRNYYMKSSLAGHLVNINCRNAIIPNTVLIRFQSSCACQTGKTNFDVRYIDKGRLRKLAFSCFRTDGSSYHHRALAMATLYSPFDFDVIAYENVCRGMIYLADSRNPSFSLLFGVRAVFRIYNDNLSSPRQIYTSPHKPHGPDNDFRTYRTLSFRVVLERVDQVLSFLQALLCRH